MLLFRPAGVDSRDAAISCNFVLSVVVSLLPSDSGILYQKLLDVFSKAFDGASV